MNWITKKIVLSKLSQYFSNLNEDDIEISILVHHHIKLRNIVLKTDIFQSNDQFVLPTECRVGYLEIQFDFSSDTPLSIKVSNATIIFKINENAKKEQKPSNDGKIIKDYESYLKKNQDFTYQSFFQKKKQQLKDWFIGILTEKTSLFLKDIQIALQYPMKGETHFIGISLQSINIKSRTIINEQFINSQQKSVHISNLGMFVGIQKQINVLKKRRQNRQTLVLRRSIDKLYFVKNCEVYFHLNIFNKVIDVQISNFILNATPTSLKQIMEFSRYLIPLLDRSRPKMRPGQGSRKKIGNILMSEGSANWWKYISLKVMQQISKKRRYNILLNPSYRKYLYCLLIHIVYQDKNQQLLNHIYCFQVNRPIIQILKVRQYLIQRINSIQRGSSYQRRQNIGFFKLIGSFKKFGYLSVKQCRYQDIQRSRRWNILNGKNYIKKLEIQNLFKFSVKVKCKKIQIFIAQNNLLYDFIKLNKQQKLNQTGNIQQTKNDYIKKVGQNFLKHALGQLKQGFKKDQFEKQWNTQNIKNHKNTITLLEINDLQVIVETNSKIQLTIVNIVLNDLNKIVYNSQILKIERINISYRLVDRQMITTSLEGQKSQIQIFLDYFCLTLQKSFVQKIIFLIGLVNLDFSFVQGTVEFQKTMREVLYQNMSKMQKKQDQNQIFLYIRRSNVMLPCNYSTKGDILGLQLLSFKLSTKREKQQLQIGSIRLALINSYLWKENKQYSLTNQNSNNLKESLIMSLGQMKICNTQMIERKNLKKKNLSHNFISVTQFAIPLILIEISIKEFFVLTYLLTLWKSVNINPLSFLYVKSPMKRRNNHQYLSQNEQVLVNNVNSKVYFSILGLAISFLPLKKQKQQSLFWIFMNDFDLNITSKTFETVKNCRLRQFYIQNVSNHYPINRGILQSFSHRMLKDGDKRNNHKNIKNMNSLNLLLEKDISDILPLQSFKIKSNQSLPLYQEDPEQILNAVQFRQNQKNYFAKKLVIMNQGQKFLRVSINDNYNLNTHQQQQLIKVILNPLHILFEVVFFRNIILLLNSAVKFSENKLQIFYDYMKDKGMIPLKVNQQKLVSFIQQNSQQNQLLNDETVVINAKLSKYTNIDIQINKLILMVFHHNSVNYCMNLVDINIYLEEKYLFTDMNLTLKQLHVVDIKQDSGSKKQIISLKSENQTSNIKAFIRSFKNKVLIQRHNCSSQTQIKIDKLQAIFLKKKIIQLVDIVKYFISQLEDNKQQSRIIGGIDSFTKIQKQQLVQNKSNTPVPHYVIQLTNSQVIIMQNSVSNKHVISKIEKVVISNRNEDQQINKHGKFENSNIFQECQQLDENNQQFISFQRQNEEINNLSSQKIYINIFDVDIFDQNDINFINPIISSENVKLQLMTTRQLMIGVQIERIQGDINQDQYTFIMRMLDQNFDQFPNILTPKAPRTQALNMYIAVKINTIFAQISVPINLIQNLQVLIQRLQVKLFMYENDKKQIKLGISSILVNSVANNDKQIIIKTFVPQKSMNTTTISKLKMINLKQQMQRQFSKRDLIKQNTLIKGKQQGKSLKMSMMENRQKFMAGLYHEKPQMKQTKFKKITNCMTRFCGKCCQCCFKNPHKTQTTMQQPNEQINSNLRLIAQKQFDIDLYQSIGQQITDEQNLNKEHIQSNRLILRRKSYPANVFELNDQQNEFVKLYMITEAYPSHENVKKIKVQNMNFNVQQQHILIALLNFIIYPFNTPNREIKQNRNFNRFPPNSIQIQISNIRLVIGNGMNNYFYNFIQVLVDLKLVMQDEGDVTYGPGQQRWDASACININFCKANSQNKYYPIVLCRDARFMYSKKIQVPFYKNKYSSYEKKQLFYITGNNNQIHFKIPLSELKSIIKLFQKINQTNTVNNTSTTQKQKQQQQQVVLFHWTHQEQKAIISQFTLQLQRGLTRALVQVTLFKIYAQMEGIANLDKEYQKKATAYGTISGSYVNMSNGYIQPFIQPWSFLAKSEESFQQNQLIILKKIASRKTQNDSNNNCLNINVTTSLLKNLKDAETRYKFEGVVLDDCFYNMLDKNYYNIEVAEEQQDQLISQYKFLNIDHRNFFGKKFTRLRNQKNSYDNKHWNLNLQQYIMLYSFLDQFTGRKIVQLKTPYSIRNLCGTLVQLSFDVRKLSSLDKWQIKIKDNQTYCIPRSIYDYDYLITVTLDNQPKGKAVSVLALLKQYQQRSQFQQLLENNPLKQKAFRLLQGNPKKYIAKNDFILKAGYNILIATVVKIQYQLERVGFSNNQQKLQQTFETQVILVPPLIIKNELSMRMQMFIDDKSIIIEPNSQKIIIDLPQNILNVHIYFKKVTSSKRFQIFCQNNLVQVYQIHISQGYNMNMKCIKMSQFGRYLILYSNYIIKNFTFQNFQIFHKGNKILLEKSFWFFITQDEDKNIDSKFSQINFYKGQDKPCLFDPKLQKQIIQLKRFLLSHQQEPKKIKLSDETQILPGDQQFYLQEHNNKSCRCCKKKNTKQQINFRIKVYDFVMRIKHHQNEISKTICIYYKYQIKNNTNQEFILYHEDVELFTMRPNSRYFLFKYESNSNRFRIGYVLESKMGNVRAFSRPFKIDGIQDFMIKIKSDPEKPFPYDRNHLFRVIISEQQELFLIEFMPAPSKQQFLFYLQNSTSYNARIKQTDQEFYLPKKQKIPFFWSNLDFEKSNVLFVEIQGHSKQFVMNQLDQFQPLVLEQFHNRQQKVNGITFKKGYLGVSYCDIKGEYLCVCDVLKQTFTIFSQKGNSEYQKLQRIQLLQAAYMNTNGKNIFIYLPDGNKMTLLAPSDQQHKIWREAFNNSLTVRTFHKIMLRIESTDTNRILKLYQLKGDQSKTVKRIQYNVNIENLAITLIDSTPKQIVLLGFDRFRLFNSQQFRSNNQDTLVRIKQQNILQFGKIKLNNNLQNTQHPVIQAGSRKTQNPYFQIKTIKTHFHNYTKEEMKHVSLLTNKDKRTNHYNIVRIFLDQTEIIIDNANFNELQKVIYEVNQMIEIYSIHEEDKKVQKDIDIRHSPKYLRHAHQKELYINQLSIQPIKVVVSAKWNSGSFNDLQMPSQIAILKAMPFGIDHAVVKLKGFVSYHVNQNTEVLLNRLKEYYMQDIVVQILKNAGSYQLFVPLRIIKGVGSGAKQIFYDPIYTLFTKRDIKSSSTKVFEGCVGFVSTIVEVIFKFISVVFNIFAFLTFDSNYNARRNALLRTTMKNPRFALVHAGYWWLKLIPQVIFGFYYRPKQQYLQKGLLGIPFGFFSACLGLMKPLIGIYDFIHCIWMGFVNMADYQPQPMKFRTRPVRLFKNNMVKSFNRNQALAHEIMTKNKITQIKNQSVQYAQEIFLKGRPVHIIITNYRLIISKETFSYNSIKFYKIKEIFRTENLLNIILNIPDIVSCCICLTKKKKNFVLNFDEIKKAELIEYKLKDTINKNSHNVLQRSEVLKETPFRKSKKSNMQ